MPDRSVPPGKAIENMLRIIHEAFRRAQVPYFLSFGALYGLVRNEGTIPDGDFDVCTYYGQDHNKLIKAFESMNFECSKVLINDIDNQKALYCSFNPRDRDASKYLHICCMFLYPHGDALYWCHDTKWEVSGVGVPPSGYYFKGVEATYLRNSPSLFREVEWPGIIQRFKVRVPLYSGYFLDECYPYWAFKTQKFNIPRSGVVKQDGRKTHFHKGGASPSRKVWVNSMSQWSDPKHVQTQLINSGRDHMKYIRNLDGRK